MVLFKCLHIFSQTGVGEIGQPLLLENHDKIPKATAPSGAIFLHAQESLCFLAITN